MRHLLATAAAILFASAVPAPAHANSPVLQRVVIPASACQPARDPLSTTPTIEPELRLDEWALLQDGRSLLLCPVPVGGSNIAIDRVRVLYKDPDGRRGNASVKVFVSVTSLDPPAGLLIYTSCSWRSNFNGNGSRGWTSANIVCPPVPIPPGSRAEITVELRRGAGADPSQPVEFSGIDFP